MLSRCPLTPLALLSPLFPMTLVRRSDVIPSCINDVKSAGVVELEPVGLDGGRTTLGIFLERIIGVASAEPGC